MKRADRHNEIELNLLRKGSLTYLMGGGMVTIPAGRLAVFWAAIPHQIISSEDDAEYYVATIPLAWFIQCQFPEHFVDAILHARVVRQRWATIPRRALPTVDQSDIRGSQARAQRAHLHDHCSSRSYLGLKSRVSGSAALSHSRPRGFS